MKVVYTFCGSTVVEVSHLWLRRDLTGPPVWTERKRTASVAYLLHTHWTHSAQGSPHLVGVSPAAFVVTRELTSSLYGQLSHATETEEIHEAAARLPKDFWPASYLGNRLRRAPLATMT